MKIYLAGNYGMSAEERERLYLLFSTRLLSFYEISPGRFCSQQWEWLKEAMCKSF